MSTTDGTEPITNTEGVIDSRDVIARITYLMDCQDDETPVQQLTADEREELATLIALQDEAEPYAADWQYGETLIRDSYFEDYARELADDLGMIPSDAKWPASCIDWAQAARELQQDYTQVSFAGVTYWVR